MLSLVVATGYCVRLPDGAPPSLLWTVCGNQGPQSFADRTGDVLLQAGLLQLQSSAGSMCRYVPSRAAWRMVLRWRRCEGLADAKARLLGRFRATGRTPAGIAVRPA